MPSSVFQPPAHHAFRIPISRAAPIQSLATPRYSFDPEFCSVPTSATSNPDSTLGHGRTCSHGNAKSTRAQKSLYDAMEKQGRVCREDLACGDGTGNPAGARRSALEARAAYPCCGSLAYWRCGPSAVRLFQLRAAAQADHRYPFTASGRLAALAPFSSRRARICSAIALDISTGTAFPTCSY